ncbi:GSCFA domain-containing protein [Fulvivirga sp. 29W222]|uniref:GSCFA domain-containing protein n=1 Tax=Fulvivirga marina TaxID=2494733 RepID=A0A937FUG3_9BACT|nr:GSCFA domain-containing protein [Fulvivirga marina]MBL6445132.1 GSCFA domain-containing protein [Fulvivirga marina]
MFRTEIIPKASRDKINISSPVLSIGSCFSDCMGQRFANYKFDSLANPYGTVYNPVSIFKLLGYTLSKNYPDQSTYVETQGLQANYDFHSSFSHEEPMEIENSIHEAIDLAHKHLKKSNWLIMTFGTSFIYRRKSNQEIVANCHKIPARHFSKELLTQKQIIERFEAFNQQLMSNYPDIRIILTVSPVRHIKDTMEQNSVSKSILRITCDTLEREYDNIQYFPSYEIMMDDLRDYRFYKTDMIHPTLDAEDYIWKKFSEAYLDADTVSFIEEWDKILKAIHHRPFNPASDAHQNFLQETITRVKRLEGKIDIKQEVALLEQQLIKK